LQAQRLRLLIRDDFDRVFKSRNILHDNRHGHRETISSAEQARVDFLLHPSAIRTAPKLDRTVVDDTLGSYVQDILTVPASLAGLPAISLPAGYSGDGWPLGVSLVGQWGSDTRLLAVANAIEPLSLEY
jgi:aspartyl-tRNA(Asn)/glutamyl-tRNA(Gln) amidotransferase subunit A